MKKLVTLVLLILSVSFNVTAQTDSLATEQIVAQDTVLEKSSKEKQSRRVSDLKIYGGVSGSKILLSNSTYESAYAAGYILGVSYRKGKYGYWEVGLNYNGSVIALDDVSTLEQNMPVVQTDLPLTAGINLLGAARRVLGLRLFGGLVPGYITRLGSNPFGLTYDDLNRLQLSGRLGVGVDIFFFFIEVGYNYGFIDLLNNQDSNMSQGNFILGFRF